MKNILIAIFILPLISNAQQVALIDKSVNPSEVIDELPLPPPKTLGSFYITEEWKNGDIWLKNNKILKGYPIRYDLKNNMLEIDANGEIKVCALPLLVKFSYKEKLGDSVSYFNTSEVNNITYDLPRGICKVIMSAHKLTVIQYQFIEIKEATYNIALDMGDRNNKAYKKETTYAVYNDEVYKVSGSVKKNADIFGDKTDKVNEFAKKNKLKLKSEKDLKSIFEYFASL